MKLFTSVLALSSIMLLVGCGGGGSRSSSSVYYPTHAELADRFVDKLRVDLNYDVSLMKTYTRQTDYIVVYDYDYNTYDAYDLSGFSYYSNVSDYIDYNDHNFFYDLDYVGGNVYEDWYTGIQFNKTQMTPVSMSKAAALVTEIKKRKAKNILNVEFGLAPERADEVATMALQMQSMDKDSLTAADYDSFAQEVVGVSFTKLKSAMKQSANGQTQSLEEAYELAALKNETSVEHVKKLAESLLQE